MYFLELGMELDNVPNEVPNGPVASTALPPTPETIRQEAAAE